MGLEWNGMNQVSHLVDYGDVRLQGNQIVIFVFWILDKTVTILSFEAENRQLYGYMKNVLMYPNRKQLFKAAVLTNPTWPTWPTCHNPLSATETNPYYLIIPNPTTQTQQTQFNQQPTKTTNIELSIYKYYLLCL